MTKKKKIKKIKLPENSQEYYDIDYWNDLSDDDKRFITEFFDGTLGNNCRKYQMFLKHPDYDRIRKEIYSETNARNRDIYSKARAGRRLLSIDFLADTKEERYISKILSHKINKQTKEDILVNFGIKSFEDLVVQLLEETVDIIRLQTAKSHHNTLLNFYLTLNTLIKEENKYRRSQRD